MEDKEIDSFDVRESNFFFEYHRFTGSPRKHETLWFLHSTMCCPILQTKIKLKDLVKLNDWTFFIMFLFVFPNILINFQTSRFPKFKVFLSLDALLLWIICAPSLLTVCKSSKSVLFQRKKLQGEPHHIALQSSDWYN